MKPDELEKIPLRIEPLFYDMQNRVMEDIVRRIRKTGGITSTADYQIERLTMLGNSTEFIESEIKKTLQAANPEIWELYDEVVEKDYTRNKDIYEQINRSFVPYEDNKWLQNIVNSVVKQTNNDIFNLSGSMGFSILYGTKRVFTPISEYYQKYLDRACLDIVTGTFDYGMVLRRVIKEMTASGIRTVDYATGHSNRITVAARRAVLTGVHQLSAKINERVAEELETDTFEVTAHSGARPSHRVWQGGIYTRKELERVCGLGDVAGLCGANCRHSYYPFVKGVSTPAYTREQLEELNRQDAERREFRGKSYDAYEATQKQRQYETKMRAQRENVKLLKSGKADQNDILAAQTRYVQTLHEYQAFSKKMELHTQMERVYMDGLGRIAPTVERVKLGDSTDKTQKKVESENKKSRYSRFSDRFQTYNNGQKDIITYRRLLNNLNKSAIGKETVEYILSHPELEIQMCYGIDHDRDSDGVQFGDVIRIYASDTKTVQRTAEVLIHEVTHHKYDIGGSLWAECVCKAQEIKHKSGRDKLTGEELRSIIKLVKELYPEYSWR